MTYRLSGKLIACLHVSALLLITAVFAERESEFWPAPAALYLFGACMLWLTSLPGAKSRLLRGPDVSSTLSRAIARHGLDHGGHASRRAWDWSGLNSRILLQFLCLVTTGLSLIATSAADPWLVLLAGVAFSLGVESGFAAFRTGDEAELQRHHRPTIAPDNER